MTVHYMNIRCMRWGVGMGWADHTLSYLLSSAVGRIVAGTKKGTFSMRSRRDDKYRKMQMPGSTFSVVFLYLCAMA